jgi:hypothetical protein
MEALLSLRLPHHSPECTAHREEHENQHASVPCWRICFRHDVAFAHLRKGPHACG